MSADLNRATDALNRRFFIDHPQDAARNIEELRNADIIEVIKRQSAETFTPVWRLLLPEKAAQILRLLPDEMADQLISQTPPSQAVRLLGYMTAEEVRSRLSRLDSHTKKDLETLLSYPNETAGRLMNTAVSTFRREATTTEALNKLRSSGMRTAKSLFLVDSQHRLTGKASLTNVALAAPDTPLSKIEDPILATVRPIDSISLVTQAFESGNILDLPVLDLDGVFLGAVTHEDLARTIRKDATVDIQTMVGASKEERALSSPFFTVQKRMPWLQINLLTAFMAAAVVGVFEATIAQVTALAVLLPVVAGQSGNTGAQALAVTMRGLALREVTVRQWAGVMRKEVIAGLFNGMAVAVTCGIGVYIWSRSLGLVAVIMSSMIIAMIAAGFAGAVIPMILTRLGQDPATSSSIILTTVTDITGFFAFLGIATLMMNFL